MRLIVVAVFDVQAQTFMRPLFVATRGVGVRVIGDEVNRAALDNPLYQHPEDFRVFDLGEWDDASGMFQARGIPELIVDCVALKADSAPPVLRSVS